MAIVTIPLVGPTYQSSSMPVDNQITQNFFIELDKVGGVPAALIPFPGCKAFGTTGAGVDRGMGEHDGVGYKVTGSTLYSFDNTGTATSIGTIPGNDRCVLTSDGVNLVITYGTGKPITWDGTTLTTGTDVDLPNAKTSAYINRRIAYDGAGRNLPFADLDTALSVNSANVTLVDTSPKDVLAVMAQDQQLIVFSEDRITPYYNSGVGNPPFDTIQNATKRTGLKAIYSLAQNNDFIYFLDANLRICRYAGLQVQDISNPAIGHAIAGYASPGAAVGLTFTLKNTNFYMISFTEATWLFSEDTGWTSLAYGTSGAPSLINSYLNIYGKHLVGDRRNGNIYELDFETYTDNGDVLQVKRDTININGATFGKPGAKVFWDSLQIRLEGGTSLISGQGSDAQIMMSYSDDFGHTFSPEQWAPIGPQGEYQYVIEWFGLGESYNRQFRFVMSDPVKRVWLSLSAEIELEI